jgi:hypothetical protein
MLLQHDCSRKRSAADQDRRPQHRVSLRPRPVRLQQREAGPQTLSGRFSFKDLLHLAAVVRLHVQSLVQKRRHHRLLRILN